MRCSGLWERRLPQTPPQHYKLLLQSLTFAGGTPIILLPAGNYNKGVVLDNQRDIGYSKNQQKAGILTHYKKLDRKGRLGHKPNGRPFLYQMNPGGKEAPMEIALHPRQLQEFRRALYADEKSPATIRKYLYDMEVFFRYAQNQPVTKELVVAYKGVPAGTLYCQLSQHYVGVSELLFCLGRRAGAAGKDGETPAGHVPRRQGIDENGVSMSFGYRSKTEKVLVEVGYGGHLRHRDSGQRTAAHHRGGGPLRHGKNHLQRETPADFSAKEALRKIERVLSAAED